MPRTDETPRVIIYVNDYERGEIIRERARDDWHVSICTSPGTNGKIRHENNPETIVIDMTMPRWKEKYDFIDYEHPFSDVDVSIRTPDGKV